MTKRIAKKLGEVKQTIIEPSHWMKWRMSNADYCPDGGANNPPTCFCLMGACWRVARGPDAFTDIAGSWPPIDSEKWKLYAALINALQSVLPKRYRNSVGDYNDQNDHRRVLALVDKAIARELGG